MEGGRQQDRLIHSLLSSHPHIRPMRFRTLLLTRVRAGSKAPISGSRAFRLSIYIFRSPSVQARPHNSSHSLSRVALPPATLPSWQLKHFSSHPPNQTSLSFPLLWWPTPVAALNFLSQRPSSILSTCSNNLNTFLSAFLREFPL